ncbi:hypothetical protein MLD38_021124 [Melastoma candidum]|uniref:Uncharacterized protein n=1 Tax=Melastoma candidum TaxID=119954 RepID=A0ACB9QFL1_9MYRT|nr:hypothetical protein MLD38_021124 [Melastoma candidum]
MDRPEIHHLTEIVLIDGRERPLTLTSDGRFLWPEGGQRSFSVEREVLGFAADGPRKVKVRVLLEEGGGFCVGAGNVGSGKLVRRELVFEALTEESSRAWCSKLEEYIGYLGRPKRLCVLLNPFGGKKIAPRIFANDVRPLLVDAGIDIDVKETQYQSHAKEIAHSLDLSTYDGIVCVSGDGILVEVINGLLEREDWESAIRMPIGVVPAGTGNGMAKSLLDAVGQPCSPSHATLAIIQGNKQSLDVATIVQQDKKFFSVLMLAWGLVADIDIESEKYRWMGSARIDFYAIQRILHLRRYTGRISFVPAPGYESYGVSLSSINTYKYPVIAQVKGYRGPDVSLEESSWRTIEGPFVSIWLHNVPWGAEKTMAAPKAQFSDGYLDLIAIRDCPKLALLSLMTELSNGGHVKSPHVTYLKVKAFVLEPGPRAGDPKKKEGIIDADGEVLARGAGTYKCEQASLMSYDRLQITVHQGLATVFCPK